MLKWEMHRQTRFHPNTTFLDDSSDAIHWVEEDEHSSGNRPRAHFCSAQLPMPSLSVMLTPLW